VIKDIEIGRRQKGIKRERKKEHGIGRKRK
jgi:hypothetical protein